MLRSLIKSNLILVWPHKIICYQSQWGKAFENKKEIFKLQNDDHTLILAKLSEFVSQLPAWQPTKLILLGNKLIYRLVSHHEQLSPSELIVLMEHQIQKVLGRKTVSYLTFSQRPRYQHSNLAVGIDAQWLEAIKSIVVGSELYFTDIQPAASWLFNKLRKQLLPNGWNIVNCKDEIYFFKSKDSKLEHFKAVSIKVASEQPNIVRKEILMHGEDPTESVILFYELDALIKNSKTLSNPILMAEKSAL